MVAKRFSLLFFCLMPLLGVMAQSRWMTALDDTLPVTALSIPGAHDAATSSIKGMGRCQVLTLGEQLHAGVRAFDLRPTQCRRKKGLGNIYHGLKNTGVSLDEAFACFNAFLEANPGEFIVVLLRDESDGRYLFGKPASETFTASVREFLKEQPRIVAFRADLRVGACRGGIIVLCRTGTPDDMASTYLTWNHRIAGSDDRRIHYDRDASVALMVQDCYSPEMVTPDCGDEDYLRRKLAVTETFLNNAARASGVWVINHASGYVGRNNYSHNAEWMNLRLSRYIQGTDMHATKGKQKPAGPTGILMMDFAGVGKVKYRGKTYDVAGDALLRTVIANNFIVLKKNNKSLQR